MPLKLPALGCSFVSFSRSHCGTPTTIFNVVWFKLSRLNKHSHISSQRRILQNVKYAPELLQNYIQNIPSLALMSTYRSDTNCRFESLRIFGIHHKHHRIQLSLIRNCKHASATSCNLLCNRNFEIASNRKKFRPHIRQNLWPYFNTVQLLFVRIWRHTPVEPQTLSFRNCKHTTELHSSSPDFVGVHQNCNLRSSESVGLHPNCNPRTSKSVGIYQNQNPCPA